MASALPTLKDIQLEPQLLATIALGLAVVCLAWTLLSRSKSTVSKLPKPPGASWIWGHEKTVFMNEPGRVFREWTGALGLTYRIKAAFRAPDVLILSDPDGISHILQKRIYDYHHSKVVRPRVARLLGEGLGWVEGEDEHKRMKKLVNPSLSAENVKAMSQEVHDAASRALDDLTADVSKHEGTLRMNILDWTGKVTLNVIGRAAFQHDFEGGNSDDALQILNARKKAVSAIARYAGFLTLMLLRRFPILNDLPIAAIQAQGTAKVTIQNGVAHEMVRRNQDVVKHGQKDLLSRLLTAHAAGEISKAELYEQISTFVISGHETTTQTLGYTLFELARHPDAQARLRAELAAFAREPTYDDFASRLPYLDAVLRETLRLYPGLPYMERIATKPDVIPLAHAVRLPGGQEMREVVVEPGQTVLIPIIAIHRLERLWADPDAFRPARWLASAGVSPAVAEYSGWANTLAFSDGPRSCIGMRLAIFQYKVIMAALIQRFAFEDTGADISLKISSSLQPWVRGQEGAGPQLPVGVRLL
ncbi:cytochrome P450 [Dentipellis sp. KUC8613]|nr:cytochrome P450 [Dentipellis sp. KUC8613]